MGPSKRDSIALITHRSQVNPKTLPYFMQIGGSTELARTKNHAEKLKFRESCSAVSRDLANAIRSGDVDGVKRTMTRESLNARLKFHLSVDKPSFSEPASVEASKPNARRSSNTIAKGKRLVKMLTIKDEQESRPLFDTVTQEKAVMEVTPLHVAIISGHAAIVVEILEFSVEFKIAPALLGARTKVTFKDSQNHKYSNGDRALNGMNAFHLSARFDTLSLKRILEFTKEHLGLAQRKELLLQKTTDLDQAILHVAAKYVGGGGLGPLLDAISEVTEGNPTEVRDFRGYTPLHIAARNGRESNAIFLLEHGAVVDARGNKPGAGDSGENFHHTPLHTARSPSMVQILLRYGAEPDQTVVTVDETSRQNKVESALMVLMSRNPAAAREILNSFIFTNGKEMDSSDFEIGYDFEIFHKEALINKTASSRKEESEFAQFESERSRPESDAVSNEMLVHSKMLDLKLENMLKNPLAEAFLLIKWHKTNHAFLFNLIQYLFFVLFLSALAITDTWVAKVCKRERRNETSDIQTQNCDLGEVLNFLEGRPLQKNCMFVFYAFAVLGWALIMAREVIQACHEWDIYKKEKENWLEGLMLLFVPAYLICLFLDRELSPHLGAASIFLAWMDMTLLVGRFPSIGIYIYMSVHVIKILLYFFAVYFTALLAFALAFHILLPYHSVFDHPLTALLKILVMMSGEFDFEDNFTFNKVKGVGSNFSTQVLFILFFFIVSLIIANLVIGLTVAKTQELFEMAGIIKLQKTVLQIVGLESILMKLPTRLRELLLSRTQVFKYLKTVGLRHSVPDEDQFYSKVCVCPNVSTFVPSDNLYDQQMYDVYLYDEARGCKSSEAKLDVKLPGWIIHATLGILREREERDSRPTNGESHHGEDKSQGSSKGSSFEDSRFTFSSSEDRNESLEDKPVQSNIVGLPPVVPVKSRTIPRQNATTEGLSMRKQLEQNQRSSLRS